MEQQVEQTGRQACKQAAADRRQATYLVGQDVGAEIAQRDLEFEGARLELDFDDDQSVEGNGRGICRHGCTVQGSRG